MSKLRKCSNDGNFYDCVLCIPLNIIMLIQHTRVYHTQCRCEGLRALVAREREFKKDLVRGMDMKDLRGNVAEVYGLAVVYYIFRCEK